MTTSKQETMLEQLRTSTLAAIDGTGNYNLSLTTISRDVRLIGELLSSDFPAIFIVDEGVTAFTPMTGRGYTTGGSIGSLTDGWLVSFLGMVNIDRQIGRQDSGPLSTEQNKMMSDIMIAIEADPDLGGNCLQIVLVGMEKAVQHGEKSTRGLILLTYSIKYDFQPSASTPTT